MKAFALLYVAVFAIAFVSSPPSAVAQQQMVASSSEALSSALVGRWEADGPDLLQLQVTVVFADGRFVGSHRVTDYADGKQEYYPFEGRAEDGRFIYAIEVENRKPLSYVLWRDGEFLRGHLLGHPDRLTTFIRQR